MKKIITTIALIMLFGMCINADEPQLILVEQITTSSANSPQLTPISAQFNSIVNSSSEVLPLTIHTNFNPDKFWEQRKDLSNRVLEYVGQGEEYPIPIFFVNGTRVNDINQLSSTINSKKGKTSPLLMKVQMDRSSSATLFVDVKINTDTTLKVDDLLYCAIIERHINDPSAGNPSEKDFYYVTRRIGLQPTSGDQILLNKFGYSGNRFAFPIENFWNLEEIYAIAWVQNTTSDLVLQAEEMKTYNEKPEIQSEVDEVIFDESNKNNIYTFKIYNSTMGYLDIESISLDNEADFTILHNADITRLHPGKSKEISVELDKTEIGSYTGNIIIKSNADKNPSLSIPINATVENSASPVIVSSTDLLEFGEVSTSLTKDILISNTGNGPLKIDSVYFSNDYNGDFKVLSNFIPDIEEGKNFKLNLLFSPTEEQQYFTTLVIKSNATNSSELSVEVRGEGKGLKQFASISLAVDSLDFGTADFVTPARKSIVISNTGNISLEVKNSAIEKNSGSAFSFVGNKDLTVAGGSQDSLVLEFSPTENIEYNATLVVRSNDENIDRRRIEIPLRGMGDGPSTVTNYVEGFNTYFVNQNLMLDLKNDKINKINVRFYDLKGNELLNKDYDIQQGVSQISTNSFNSNSVILYQITSKGKLLSNGKFVN